MKQYLAATAVIDWHNSNILQLAQQLATPDITATAKACFEGERGRGFLAISNHLVEWVRDNIYHSSDYKMNPVTCRASQVLRYKTGYCFAKSHLLAALLRANSIPTGFCYQRLSVFDNGAPYSLHGFNAVHLPKYGWYRLDARGNKQGVNAQFNPPQEQLAYGINFPEEIDCKRIFAEPLAIVVKALQTYTTWDEALHNLPDVERKNLSPDSFTGTKL